LPKKVCLPVNWVRASRGGSQEKRGQLPCERAVQNGRSMRLLQLRKPRRVWRRSDVWAAARAPHTAWSAAPKGTRR
jgi:hypothetical protein